MPKEIFMPKLSSTMQVGTLLQWFKNEGDTVEVGEPLFEIMTDKINIEVEAYEEGVLLKQYYQVDEEIPVNFVIGYIGNADEQVPSQSPGLSGSEPVEGDPSAIEPVPELGKTVVVEQIASAGQNGEEGGLEGKIRATPAARRAAKGASVKLKDVQGTGPKGRIQQQDVYSFTEQMSRQKVTPLARKLAVAHQVDLGQVTGSGVNGKITRKDIEGTVVDNKVTRVSETTTRVKLDGMRKVIAKRMTESAQTAPHVTLHTEVDMTEAIRLRENVLESVMEQVGYRLSYTEIIVRAVAYALKKHPILRASLQGDSIVFQEEINIGLAVAVPNGLMVPVIQQADQKGLALLTKECKELAGACREQTISASQLSGGAFTISNLGMYAVDHFNPIINQPESAILGVCRIKEKPVVVAGQVVVRPMMGLSLSFDHRVCDGAPAAAYLTDLVRVLEEPFQLLI